MSEDTRRIILRHWELANDRRWSAFAELLDPNLRYDVPQTREFVESGEGYLDMFRTWPGDWKATIQHLVCDGDKAVCVIDFVVGAASMTGISVFELAGGRLTRVVDYWPEPYDPPPRVTPHLKRQVP